MRKNQGLSEKERRKAEAEFNAEKARLESEFNERLLQSQREAAPSDSANSPGKVDASKAKSPQAIRLVPSGVAKEEPRPEVVTPQPVADQAVAATPKKSVKSVKSAAGSSVASPQATRRMSAL